MSGVCLSAHKHTLIWGMCTVTVYTQRRCDRARCGRCPYAPTRSEQQQLRPHHLFPYTYGLTQTQTGNFDKSDEDHTIILRDPIISQCLDINRPQKHLRVTKRVTQLVLVPSKAHNCCPNSLRQNPSPTTQRITPPNASHELKTQCWGGDLGVEGHAEETPCSHSERHRAHKRLLQ